MKKFKYFLALPLALSAVTACGGSNFKKIGYDDAVKIVENYKKSIKNSKAANISVSGHVDKIDIKGDVTWWSYTEQEETKQEEKKIKSAVTKKKKSKKGGLLSMIPNFSLTNSEIHVDNQEIAEFTMPGSMVSLVDTVANAGDNEEQLSLLYLDNLPKFPMNSRLLMLANGFESLVDTKVGKKIPWDEIKPKDWENATVSYGSSNGRLKITLETDDTESFVDEFKERIGVQEQKKNEDPEKIKVPGSISVTTNNLGYIDSASINFKFKDIDKEASRGELYYLHIKGDAEFQVSLKFKQEISKPITVKYQLTPYHATDFEKGETATDYYSHPNFGKIPLTKETDNIISPTTDLDKLSNYVTFDWYSNVTLKDDDKEVDPTQHYELTKNYDDPIFEINYWHGEGDEGVGKNVAFTDEDYDVIVLPTYEIKDKKPNQLYAVLGAQLDNDETIQNSFVTTSVDGRIISSDQGIPLNFQKALLSAADVTKTIYIKKGETEAEDIGLGLSDEIFINSNMLSADGSECVVNIPVVKIPEGK